MKVIQKFLKDFETNWEFGSSYALIDALINWKNITKLKELLKFAKDSLSPKLCCLLGEKLLKTINVFWIADQIFNVAFKSFHKVTKETQLSDCIYFSRIFFFSYLNLFLWIPSFSLFFRRVWNLVEQLDPAS